MNDDIMYISIPLDVDCPVCDAEVGELCVDAGVRVQPAAHAGRMVNSKRGVRWRGPHPRGGRYDRRRPNLG